ncbi:MAG: glycosyltransferase family 4 protein [Gemmatimonadaceae bacterium]
MRLALFSDTWFPQLNGVTRTLDRLAAEVIARGGAVRVFTVREPESIESPALRRYASVPFPAYPQLRMALPSTRRVVSDLSAWAPTLVHVATPFGIGLAGRAAARRLGVPLVSSYHTSLAAYARFYGLGAIAAPGWRYLRWFHNGGVRTYCPTDAVIGELEQRGFTGLHRWSRGVDTSRFGPALRSDDIRLQLGAGPDTLLVGYVGRVAPEKGIATLLQAMHRVRARTSRDVRLVVVGDGPFAPAARAMAPEDTHFTGRMEGRALASVYAALDLFAFPSATDTFGNVLLEAMASGVPVIAADVPPSRELVGPGGAALFRPDDAGGLAEAILRLAGDPAERARLAAAGEARAARASWRAVFDDLFADYHAVQADAVSSALHAH